MKGKPAYLCPVKKSVDLRTCHAQERGDEDLGTEEIVLKSQKSRRGGCTQPHRLKKEVEQE